MTPIETYEKNEYTLYIYPDPSPLNPLVEFGYFGHIVFCNGKHFDGTETYEYDADLWLKSFAWSRDPWKESELEEQLDLLDEDEIDLCAIRKKYMEIIQEEYIILPISDGGYISLIPPEEWDEDLEWDGFMYVSKEEAKKEFGATVSDEELDAKCAKLFENTLMPYSWYVQGEVYGFVLDKDDEEIESVWGFYGEYDDAVQTMEEYMPKECAGITAA